MMLPVNTGIKITNRIQTPFWLHKYHMSDWLTESNNIKTPNTRVRSTVMIITTVVGPNIRFYC
jgi:hypothetical protein